MGHEKQLYLCLKNLVICNAGLSTGLQMDQLLEEINRIGRCVTDVIMVPGKSYCFARCSTVDESRLIYEGLHGKCSLGQNDGVLYLSYCADGKYTYICNMYLILPFINYYFISF